jgi:hypothetical protein
MDTVKILPPLIIEKTEADRFSRAMRPVMWELHRFPGAAWTEAEIPAVLTAKRF